MSLRLLSSDSHSSTPENLYLENLPKKYHEGLPYREKTEDGRIVMAVRGQRMMTVSEFAHGRPGGPWQALRNETGVNGYGQNQAWEPEKRLAALDRDNVAGEVIQAGSGTVSLVTDFEMQVAVAKVWNDWAIATYKPYLSRLIPSASLPIADIDLAVKELQRLASMGYTNVQFPINPVERPYRKPEYDRLWAAVEETGMTINLHIRSGTRKSTPFSAGRVYNYCVDCTDGIVTATDLCSTGVLERFPGLKFVFLEVGGGWAAWLMHTMDGIYFAHPETSIKLKKLPSEYMLQSIYCSIMMDTTALQNFKSFPNLIFSTDRPHPEGTWPESQRRVEKQLEGAPLSKADIESFTHGNCEKLYGFPPVTPSTEELLRKVAAA